jgi:hypothetical protein
VMVNCWLPAPTVFGDTDAIVGGENPPVGVERLSGKELEVPSELDTVTAGVPGSATLAAGTVAVSCVALTNVVALTKVDGVVDSGAPFQFTTASLVKFVPFTVNVNPCVLQ